MDSGSSAARSPGAGSRLREHVEVSVPGAAQPGPDQIRADTLDDPVKPVIGASPTPSVTAGRPPTRTDRTAKITAHGTHPTVSMCWPVMNATRNDLAATA